MPKHAERIVVYTGPDVGHPGTTRLGPSLDGGDVRIRTPRSRKPLSNVADLGLFPRPSLRPHRVTEIRSQPDDNPTEAETDDLIYQYRQGARVYSALPGGRGSDKDLALVFVSALPSKQGLIPVADDKGDIVGMSIRGALVHNIGIEGLGEVEGLGKIKDGWLLDSERIDPTETDSIET